MDAIRSIFIVISISRTHSSIWKRQKRKQKSLNTQSGVIGKMISGWSRVLNNQSRACKYLNNLLIDANFRTNFHNSNRMMRIVMTREWKFVFVFKEFGGI